MTDRLEPFRVVKSSFRNTSDFVRALNRLVDAVNTHSELLDRSETETVAVERRSSSSGRTSSEAGETVRLGNDTGEELGIYHAVRVASPTDESDKADALNDYHGRGYDLKGKKPEGEDAVFAVTLAPGGPGAVVPARITGTVGITVDMVDVSHRYATTEEGETRRLVSAESGYARILSAPREEGERFCTVLLGATPPAVASDSRKFAVVVEPIRCPEQATANPADSANFRDAMGRIKIEGRNYGSGARLDYCACRELAGVSNEHPEQLIAGTQIEIISGGRFPNPDHDPDDKQSTEPEYLTWYVAVKTEGVYTGILESGLTGPGAESTIRVRDAAGDTTPLTVHSYYLGDSQTIGAGTGVMVARQHTESGDRLVVVKSRSVITNTDTT